MALDLHRLLGLLDGTVAPQNGMEAHFIRVGKGAALPASPIERTWWEAVVAHRNINSPKQSVSDSSLNHGLAFKELEERYNAASALNEKLRGENCKLQQEMWALRMTIDSNALALDDIGAKLSRSESKLADARQKLSSSVAESNALRATHRADRTTHRADLAAKAARLAELETELAAQRDDFKKKLARLDELETKFEQAVAAAIEPEIGAVVKANAEFRETNERLSTHVASLINQLKRFITPRIKCPSCEGMGTWYDQSTYRLGADWDGPRVRDVCAGCQGMGWVDNPDREALRKYT